MNERRTLRAGAVALALLGTLLASASLHAQRPAAGAGRALQRSCVRFARAEGTDGRSVELSLDNRCPVAVEGVLTWRVACGTEEGAETVRREGLLPGERRTVVASADSCGARPYSIDHVGWSWHRVGE